MSATNSRIAKLTRAYKQLIDYADHKVDWTPEEWACYTRVSEKIQTLTRMEKLRRVA